MTGRRRRRRRYSWVRLSDDALLDMRFCDLGLRIEDSLLHRRILRLYEELERREIRLRPHCWLAEEWFSPDGVPGIAIPFYLAHPRLAKLEARQMFEVEGRGEDWCMQLLRHEAGHALDSAFQLHRRKLWRRTFGRWSRKYPDHYTPNPQSKNFVMHLDWWYAQCHPAEDFAETFAVWLRPRAQWRRQYAGWPALRKLEAVDELMTSIAGKRPLRRSREHVESVSRIRKTLREHYEEKSKAYGVNVPEVYDPELRRLFPDEPLNGGGGRRLRSAAAFLREIQPDLCHICSRGIGEPPYVIGQIVQEMIQRCREMKLYLTRPEEEVRVDVAVFITVRTLNYLHREHHRIGI
jgi:ribosomal protein L20A (L18A)